MAAKKIKIQRYIKYMSALHSSLQHILKEVPPFSKLINAPKILFTYNGNNLPSNNVFTILYWLAVQHQQHTPGKPGKCHYDSTYSMTVVMESMTCMYRVSECSVPYTTATADLSWLFCSYTKQVWFVYWSALAQPSQCQTLVLLNFGRELTSL